jgi:hypothetical protein
MGLFSGDTKKTYTTTNLTQEDKSVATAGDAQNIIGSGASNIQVSEGSTYTRPNTTEGDIILNQFPEAVQSTVGKLISTVDTSIGAVGQALSRQQIGGESELSKMVMYLVIGGGIIFVASRILKR